MAMNDTQKWQLLALLVVVGVVFYLLAPILTPFAVSALLAYLGDPLVDRLERRMSRTWAVTVVFSLMLLAIVSVMLLLIPLIEKQIFRLVEGLPRYIAVVQDRVLPWIERNTGVSVERFEPANLVAMLREHWQQAGGVAAAVVGGVSRSGLAVLGFLANLALIPVVTFYLLRDWDVLVARVRMLLPRSIEPTVTMLARESDDVLGSFLRGQLSVMVSLGVIYSVGLSLVGLDLGLLIGMLAGLISFIPYLGAIVGVGVALIATLVEHGDWLHVALVLGVFGIGQTLESFLLTPWLVGDRIGMHPVAVIFAIMAGGQLFGFLGVLLALPVAAVVMVVLRYVYARYKASELYRAGHHEDAATVGAAAGAPVVVVDHVAATAAATPDAAPATPQPPPA